MTIMIGLYKIRGIVITIENFGKIMDLSFPFWNGQIKLKIERIGDLSSIYYYFMVPKKVFCKFDFEFHEKLFTV